MRHGPQFTRATPVKVIMGNVQFLGEKVLFTGNDKVAMATDCCCGGCDYCNGSDASEYDVTIAGFINGNCDTGSGCSDINGTFRLPHKGGDFIDDCVWEYVFDPDPVCTGGGEIYTFLFIRLVMDDIGDITAPAVPYVDLIFFTTGITFGTYRWAASTSDMDCSMSSTEFPTLTILNGDPQRPVPCDPTTTPATAFVAAVP